MLCVKKHKKGWQGKQISKPSAQRDAYTLGISLGMRIYRVKRITKIQIVGSGACLSLIWTLINVYEYWKVFLVNRLMLISFDTKIKFLR